MTQQNTFRKIERPQTLEEKVYDNLKQMILTGALKPGSITTETDIAFQLGVSRTPIRRALARLAQEGLITGNGNKGYRITDISLQELRELYQFREILECYIVRDIAGKFSDEELETLEKLVDEGDQLLATGEVQRFMECSRKFHHALDQKFGNLTISRSLLTLDERINRFTGYFLKVEGFNLVDPVIYAGHRNMLNALRAGNADEAVRLMQTHLHIYADFLVREIQRTSMP